MLTEPTALSPVTGEKTTTHVNVPAISMLSARGKGRGREGELSSQTFAYAVLMTFQPPIVTAPSQHVAIIVATAAVSPGSVWRADSQRFSWADVHVATILATVF